MFIYGDDAQTTCIAKHNQFIFLPRWCNHCMRLDCTGPVRPERALPLLVFPVLKLNFRTVFENLSLSSETLSTTLISNA